MCREELRVVGGGERNRCPGHVSVVIDAIHTGYLVIRDSHIFEYAVDVNEPVAEVVTPDYHSEIVDGIYLGAGVWNDLAFGIFNCRVNAVRECKTYDPAYVGVEVPPGNHPFVIDAHRG